MSDLTPEAVKTVRDLRALAASRDATDDQLRELHELLYVHATDLLDAVEERDEARSKIQHLLDHCKVDECSTCAEIVCKHHDPLHFHHDGCPACSYPQSPEAIGKAWLTNSSLEAWFPITAEQLREAQKRITELEQDVMNNECESKRADAGWDEVFRLKRELEAAENRVAELEGREQQLRDEVSDIHAVLSDREKRVAELVEVGKQLAIYAAAYSSHPLRNPTDQLHEALEQWEQTLKGGAR